MKLWLLLAAAALLVGCASSPPSKPHNLCAIFKEKPAWHRAASKASRRWDTPVSVMMAIMFQESAFRHNARPPRRWFLFVPLPRRSSAYGYPQAQDGTWNEYSQQAGSWLSSRSDFADSIDFIGWYMDKTHKRNKVATSQADLHYFAYHEGWTGYRRGSYKKKTWLKAVAARVLRRSQTYQKQLDQCRL